MQRCAELQPLSIMIADRLHASVAVYCVDLDEQAADTKRKEVWSHFLLMLIPAGEC